MASITAVIFSASSLDKSKPKCSSIARTSSTPSRESNPSSSNVAVLLNFEWSHLAADFNKNSKVTAQDALDIYKYTLGVGDLEADWVFIDSAGDYSGISKSNVVYTEGFSAENMSIDLNVALTGVLLGDVDDTYSGYLDIV